jgi:hypothetical protein
MDYIKIIIKWTSKKRSTGSWSGFIWLKTGTNTMVLFNMVTNLLVSWHVGNFRSSWLSKTTCHAGNYLPPETGLQKWIPLPSPVSSHQSLHGHVSPAVVNYKFKCAIRYSAGTYSTAGKWLWLEFVAFPHSWTGGHILGEGKGWHTCKTTSTVEFLHALVPASAW